MKVTNTFKYLGITFDNKLTFGPHVQGVYKKCQQRLYLLRKLRSFHVDPKLQLLLYSSIRESVLTYCNICFLLLCLSQRKTPPQQNCFQEHRPPTQLVSQLTESAMVRKAHAVADDPAHPPNTEFDLLPSQRRYRCPQCRKSRFENSFVSQAINRLNKLCFKCVHHVQSDH